MIVTSAGFGLSVYIEDDTLFFIASLLLRAGQGLGEAASSTAIFSIIAQEYPENREQYVGYYEGAIGLGLMLGPVIGQILYSSLGFEYTFYCTAGIIAIPLLLQIAFIPNRLNKP